MGKCASMCPKPHREEYQQIRDNICPFPCREAVDTPSDKNDKKFNFIASEKRLDWTINYLAELATLTENDATLLEQTLSELRILKQSYAPTVSCYAFENLLIIDDGKSEKHGEGRQSSERDEKFDGKESTKVSLGSKDVGHLGTLIFEIQRANFLHSKIIDKYQLKTPYVEVKLYSSPSKSLSQCKNDKWNEVQTFETLKSLPALKPQWDQAFEYNFDENQQMATYNLGISLFYISANDDSIFQIGEEQIYSVSSLLDQKVQSKQVDFKDPELKGVIARLRVRFQLVYDQEEIRKSNFREVKTRIARLMRIREKHIEMNGYKPDYDSGLNSARQAISHAESIGSVSSNHEYEENAFYVG